MARLIPVSSETGSMTGVMTELQYPPEMRLVKETASSSAAMTAGALTWSVDYGWLSSRVSQQPLGVGIRIASDGFGSVGTSHVPA